MHPDYLNLNEEDNFLNENPLSQLPSEIESEDTFVRATAGEYTAIFGRIIPVYKDEITGKYTETPSPGSEIQFARLEFILIGKLENKNYVEFISIDKGEVFINPSYANMQLIIKEFLPIDKKRQWSIHSKFDASFNPPIWSIREDGKKVTQFINFPKHYGRLVSLTLDVSKKGNIFVKKVYPGMQIFDNNLMKKIEDTIANLRKRSALDEPEPEIGVNDVPF